MAFSHLLFVSHSYSTKEIFEEVKGGKWREKRGWDSEEVHKNLRGQGHNTGIKSGLILERLRNTCRWHCLAKSSFGRDTAHFLFKEISRAKSFNLSNSWLSLQIQPHFWFLFWISVSDSQGRNIYMLNAGQLIPTSLTWSKPPAQACSLFFHSQSLLSECLFITPETLKSAYCKSQSS